METDPFADQVARLAAQPARRRALGSLGLAGVASLAGIELADAKKKKRKKKKRRVGAPPPAAAPVARADASCIIPDDNLNSAGSNSARVAQTFVAQRSGHLTQATVKSRVNPAGAACTVEIWSVNTLGFPLALLGGTSINAIPATAFPGARPLTADFANPVPVVAGTRYALVITKGDGFALMAAVGNVCPDSGEFFQNDLDDPFIPEPTVDISFETVVTG